MTYVDTDQPPFVEAGGWDETDEYYPTPIPATVRWDELDAQTYRRELTDLASWVAWLVTTYQLQASVVSPCWYLHPGHIETLSHLHIGWRYARHPDSGVGFIGSEWDERRVAAVDQLRDLVSTNDCNSTRHSKPASISWLANPSYAAGLDAHLRAEHTARAAAAVEAAGTSAAAWILVSVDAAPADMTSSGAALLAVDEAVNAAQDARADQAGENHLATSTARLTAARDALAQLIGAGVIPATNDPVRTEWEGASTVAPRPPARTTQLSEAVWAALEQYER